jgi:hypothetical protein
MYKLLALFGTASAAAAAAPAPSPLAIVIDPAMEVFAKGVDALTEVSGWVLAVPQSLADAAVWWIDLNLGMPALIRDVLTGDSVRARVPRPFRPSEPRLPGTSASNASPPRAPRDSRAACSVLQLGARSSNARLVLATPHLRGPS